MDYKYIHNNKTNITYSSGAFVVNVNGFNSISCSRLKLVIESWNKCVMSDGFSSDLEDLITNGEMFKAFELFINRKYISNGSI